MVTGDDIKIKSRAIACTTLCAKKVTLFPAKTPLKFLGTVQRGHIGQGKSVFRISYRCMIRVVPPKSFSDSPAVNSFLDRNFF